MMSPPTKWRTKAINREFSVSDYGSLANAIGAWLDAGGGIVSVEAGTYDLGSGISLPNSNSYKGLIIRGQGPGKSILNYAGTGSAFDIEAPFVTLEDLHLFKTGNSGQGVAINMKPAFSCRFKNVVIEGGSNNSILWGTGYNFDQTGDAQTGNCTIQDGLVRDCNTGLMDNARMNRVNDLCIQNCAQYEVYLANGGNRYKGCTFGMGSPVGIYGRPSSGGVVSQGASFIGCWIENVTNYAMQLMGGVNLSYTYGHIHSLSATNPLVLMDSVQTARLSNIEFSNVAGCPSDISLNNCYDVDVSRSYSLTRTPSCAPVVSVTGNPTTCGHDIDCWNNRTMYPGNSKKLGCAGNSLDLYINRTDYGYGLALRSMRSDGINSDPVAYITSGQNGDLPEFIVPSVLEITGQLNLRTKTTAGAPDDTYGWRAGTMVYNTNENKLYVRGSSGWVGVALA